MYVRVPVHKCTVKPYELTLLGQKSVMCSKLCNVHKVVGIVICVQFREVSLVQFILIPGHPDFHRVHTVCIHTCTCSYRVSDSKLTCTCTCRCDSRNGCGFRIFTPYTYMYMTVHVHVQCILFVSELTTHTCTFCILHSDL